ncbi:endoplasmic reticulum membrane-associated RNA degradation protein-like isoform X2 [Lycorma delicatula]|uniref:endoplasmic reticulum membrane-associated RNA degradation protein-like isoform X2 n=1 Tax=Lycorma delicatula TaxID=130591 RepID=UPI003F510FB4
MVSDIDSYLSSYVHNVLVDLPLQKSTECSNDHSSEAYRFVTDKLLIKWEEIDHLFGDLTEQTPSWYKSMLWNVWRVVHEIGKALLNSTLKQRSELWEMNSNLKTIIDFDKCFNKLISNSGDSKLQTVLMLTSSLERFLGNVYLLKGKIVPFLLRDLLLTKELLEIFGRVPITFTQLLVGCPLGLNIRNVAWHGFLSEKEIHLYLVGTLFILFVSLNDIVNSKFQAVPEREPVKLSFCSNLLKETFPNLSEYKVQISDILNNTCIISKWHRQFWVEAFNNFVDCRYGECLLVLLPQVEHLLRTIYCHVNACPNRLLTAEATDFYTTLDEILSPPDKGCNNQIIETLGSNLVEVLEDILFYLEGPRIRDKISHGEFNVYDNNKSDVTFVISNHVLSIALCVMLITCQKLNLHENTISKSIKSDNNKDVIDKCDGYNKHVKLCNKISELSFLKQSIFAYRSKFHPLSYLLRSVDNELNKLVLWNQLPRPNEYQFTSEIIMDRVCDLKLILLNSIFNCDKSMDSIEFIITVQNFIKNIDCLTLHRPRNEGILITLMRNILSKINNLNCVIENVSNIKYMQWRDHKMRSRSREIYQTMLQFIDSLKTTIICIICIILFDVKYINQCFNWKDTNKFLKYTLKCIENVLTYSSIERNQWQEIIKLIMEFIDYTLTYINKKLQSM